MIELFAAEMEDLKLANYWNIDIKSNNLTAEAAGDILKYMGEHHLIRYFSYSHGEYANGKIGGELHSDTRGLPNIAHILKKYGIAEDEVKWEDEFDRFWNSLPPEEFERICNEAKAKTVVAENNVSNGNNNASEYNW